ncbi:MAG: hypothetical protein WA691_09405 [Thermoplasmata archaeon]
MEIARAKRVVWVEPGTAADLRDSRIERTGTMRTVPIKLRTDRVPGVQRPNEKKRNVTLGGRDLVKSLRATLGNDVALPTMGSPMVAPHAKVGISRANRSEPPVSARDPFSVLYEIEQHRGGLEILLLLNGEGGATKSKLRQCLRPGPEALGGALRSLVRLGLLEPNLIPTFRFPTIYRLTARGRAFVECPLKYWPSLFPI